MIIGEGTNEIQRTLIARQLVERYGERLGALTSREGEPEERRQMVLAVRQFVDKSLVPGRRPSTSAAGRYPEAIVRELAELGLLGAVVSHDLGGLGLDGPAPRRCSSRSWRAAGSTVAGAVAGHLVCDLGARALRAAAVRAGPAARPDARRDAGHRRARRRRRGAPDARRTGR